jgi:microcystin-dependent protein
MASQGHILTYRELIERIVNDALWLHRNWPRADGRELCRSDYPELFQVIGTKYGEGDGHSTFRLPDFSYDDGSARVPGWPYRIKARQYGGSNRLNWVAGLSDTGNDQIGAVRLSTR